MFLSKLLKKCYSICYIFPYNAVNSSLAILKVGSMDMKLTNPIPQDLLSRKRTVRKEVFDENF